MYFIHGPLVFSILGEGTDAHGSQVGPGRGPEEAACHVPGGTSRPRDSPAVQVFAAALRCKLDDVDARYAGETRPNGEEPAADTAAAASTQALAGSIANRQHTKPAAHCTGGTVLVLADPHNIYHAHG